MQLRRYLNELYLDYRNDYLTVEKFAEHNLVSIEFATSLIEMGRAINHQGVNFEHEIAARVK